MALADARHERLSAARSYVLLPHDRQIDAVTNPQRARAGRDLNVPSFHHGGGTVAYSGQTAVPCGAFSSGFTGPSPPPGQVHTYQFSIKALGPNGAVLATTTTRRKFPE
jgi:phosphatidylethanolamine-binding protein (PEBP) family uncharacterized protein